MIQFRHTLIDCKCSWQRRGVLDFQLLRELVIKTGNAVSTFSSNRWTKSYGVTIQTKSYQRYFLMTLFLAPQLVTAI